MSKQEFDITIAVEIGPLRAASAFCKSDAQEQADFFNAVALEAKEWPGPAVCQWEEMSKYLTAEARNLLLDLGAYAESNQ